MHFHPAFAHLVAPIHLLAFSTLLGTQLYQSFIIVKILHRALPRDAFTSAQKRVFPIYFRSQSVLLVLTATTFPPLGPVSLVKEKGDWIPFIIAGTTAALNLIIFGPKTSRFMMVRKYQAEIDARNLPIDSISDEMKKLNRSFAKNHASSIHLNLITIGATLWYGWRLASRIKIDVD